MAFGLRKNLDSTCTVSYNPWTSIIPTTGSLGGVGFRPPSGSSLSLDRYQPVIQEVVTLAWQVPDLSLLFPDSAISWSRHHPINIHQDTVYTTFCYMTIQIARKFSRQTTCCNIALQMHIAFLSAARISSGISKFRATMMHRCLWLEISCRTWYGCGRAHSPGRFILSFLLNCLGV